MISFWTDTMAANEAYPRCCTVIVPHNLESGVKDVRFQ